MRLLGQVVCSWHNNVVRILWFKKRNNNYDTYTAGSEAEAGDISGVDRLAGGDKSDSSSDGQSDVPKHVLDVSSVLLRKKDEHRIKHSSGFFQKQENEFYTFGPEDPGLIPCHMTT